ncbi:hypothetical protein AZH51_15515 [Branchiibius sp. NY16-3462-2]|nr:hypothetical protein AZH51_15515 [Branchiibius sp. NY16-3462-2]
MREVQGGSVFADRYATTTLLRRADDHELWLAHDATLDREVTITLFEEDLPGAAAAVDSARRASAVEDPHLVRVLDVGSQDGLAFIVSEALHRTDSLAALAQLGALPAEEARRIVGEAAVGLGTAASRGLHHLALTPHSIERSRSGAVSVRGLAIESALAGTDDLDADAASRADTVALVHCLYAALTGQWSGPTSVAGLPDAPTGPNGTLQLPSSLSPGVPSDLDGLVEQILIDDAGPATPTALAHRLSPWSSEIVHSVSGDQAARARKAAISGGGAAAAAAPVDPTDPDATMVGRHPELEQDDTHTFDPSTLRGASIPRGASTLRVAQATEPPKHQEEYTDLEPPAPLIPDVYGDPDPTTSRLALVIVGGLVVIAMILGLLGLRSFFDRGSSTAAPSAKPSTSVSASKSTSPTSSAPVTGRKLTIENATSYDPDGDGNENNQLTYRAIDGNAYTSWSTHPYKLETFTETGKHGVGLLLTLDGSQSVNRVEVNVLGNPTTIEVYVGDQQARSPQNLLGTLNNGSGQQNVTGGPLTGKYVLLWITKLSAYNDVFRTRIGNVEVFS